VVATSVNVSRAYEASLRVRRFIEEHGTAEQNERLTRIMGGPVPPPRMVPEYKAFQSETLAILAEMIAEFKEANKPRPRGRPRKEKAKDEAA
jgi:transposase-like protein